MVFPAVENLNFLLHIYYLQLEARDITLCTGDICNDALSRVMQLKELSNTGH